MKAYLNKKDTPMKAVLELNKKFGKGYQGHLIMGPLDSVIDCEPFTLYEAAQGMKMAIDEINKSTGSHYELQKVMSITDEALRANKDRDFASAKVLHDIDSGTMKYTIPETYDYKHAEIDGKDEVLFTGRGTVLLTYFSWLDDKTPKAKECLKRYCEYLALHGGGPATPLFNSLLKMDKDSGADWIKATYGRYILDDGALIQYIFE